MLFSLIVDRCCSLSLTAITTIPLNVDQTKAERERERDECVREKRRCIPLKHCLFHQKFVNRIRQLS